MSKYIYTLFLALGSIFIAGSSLGQAKDTQVTDSLVKQIETDFSVSNKRAVEIAGVLFFNQDKIDALSLDTALATSERIEKLSALIAARKDYITQQLSATELERLKTAGFVAIKERKRQAIQQVKDKVNETNH